MHRRRPRSLPLPRQSSRPSVTLKRISYPIARLSRLRWRRAPTAGAAAAANARATTSTLAALHGIELADADLSTTGFSVGTDYMRPVLNGTQPPVTFVARNGVRVTLQTLTKLGRMIDTALAAGATQVGQAQFTSSHIEAAREAALTQPSSTLARTQ